MKILIFILLIITLVDAMDKSVDMKIVYFNAGKEKTINIPKPDRNKISQILYSLFSNCSEAFKLYIDEERIKGIKKDNSGVEIFLGKPVIFKTKSLGNYKVEKVMIPFTGDFAGSEKSSEVTIFAGESEYFTPALRNPNGFKKVKELEKIIGKVPLPSHK
jgi:hypothetical protein